MGSVGAPEILVILVLALLVLGPDRLPQAARTMGRWVGELRRLSGSLQAEVRGVVDDVMRPANDNPTGATEASTTTFATADVGATLEADGSATVASPALVSTDGPDDTDLPLAADVPLPGLEAVPPLTKFPPVDPSLN